jgi:glutathionylspermidine amidase/synthetase
MQNYKTKSSPNGSTSGVGAPFASICGIAPGGIPAFSCDYESADRTVWTSRHQYRHEHEGLYYGYRYQCVEFSRRWLIHAQGITFGDVGMAYEIFELPYAIKISDGSRIPWENIPNGATTRPVPGSVLIWDEGGEFRHTGHVAIVTDVSDDWVRIAEQNVDDTFWPEGQDYARELKVDYDPTNQSFHIHEVWGRHGGVVLGWKNLPVDFVPEPIPHP